MPGLALPLTTHFVLCFPLAICHTFDVMALFRQPTLSIRLPFRRSSRSHRASLTEYVLTHEHVLETSVMNKRMYFCNEHGMHGHNLIDGGIQEHTTWAS